MNKRIFKGTMPALLTPLDNNGKVITSTVKPLIDWEISKGAAGFYVCGSTGEGPVISGTQRRIMLEAAVSAIDKRVPIIAHVGAIDVNEACDLARHAEATGANAISSVLPNFYFQYSYSEIIEYYKRLAGSTSLPMILYAVPMMPSGDINRMMEELLQVDNIYGIKDTRANYYQMWQLRQLNGGNINIINGPDETLLCGLLMGADGGIGSTYNIMPDKYARLYKLFTEGKLEEARQQQMQITAIIKTLHKYGCLQSLKKYLEFQGFNLGNCAFPRTPLTDEAARNMKRDIDALM